LAHRRKDGDVRVAPLVAVVVAALAAAVVLWPRSGHHASSACGPVDVAPAPDNVEAVAAATLCLLNEQRRAHGLAPLAADPLLTRAAQAHSDDMVHRGYFEHTAPDGQTVQDRIRATGWGAGGRASTGENIEWGLRAKATPAAVVAKWMASPPHRADILRPAFTQIGVGIALGAPAVAGPGATYTTDFGGVFDPSLPSG
jgi:uncharacterized protein YkwD